MIKKKLLLISIFSSMLGVSLTGCANDTITESSETEESTELIKGISHRSAAIKSAFEYYNDAPMSQVAEFQDSEKVALGESLKKAETKIIRYESNEIIAETEEVTEESIDNQSENETFEEETVHGYEPFVGIGNCENVTETEVQNPETQVSDPESYSDARYNESYAGNGTKIWWTAVNSEPQLVLANGNVNGKERPSSVASRTGAAYVINGGEWHPGSGMACGVTGIGDTIYQALYDGENGDTLILRQDGQLDSVYMTEDIYSQTRPKWAVKGFVPIINGGARTAYDHARQPRTFIGQDWNGTYYIGVSGGRGSNGVGLTYDELYEFAVGQMSSDLRFLYAMDGGGSSAFVCNGSVVNNPTDGIERAVANCIVFY